MKMYEYDISAYSSSEFNTLIRNKQDLINLLLKTMKFASVMPFHTHISNISNRIVLVVDKMSRVFFYNEDKITTFCFPFIIKETDDGLLFVFHQINLDSIMTSLLISIFSSEKAFNEGIHTLFERCLDEMREYDIQGNEDEIYELVNHLISFEPGYLRYDDDNKNADKDLHPQKHLDFYYSNQNSAKVGINETENVNISFLIDILNTKTKCKYLVEN